MKALGTGSESALVFFRCRLAQVHGAVLEPLGIAMTLTFSVCSVAGDTYEISCLEGDTVKTLREEVEKHIEVALVFQKSGQFKLLRMAPTIRWSQDVSGIS